MKALIINDMQNDFVDEKGALLVEQAYTCVQPISTLKSQLKKEGIPIIYVCDTHFEQDHEFEKWGAHTVEGTWGAQIVDQLAPDEDDYVLHKPRYSAFFSTPLDLLLRQLHVDELILTGVLTDICIQHTAADAYFRGYKTVVPRSCTETLTPEKKEYALNFMTEYYGTTIIE